MQHKPWGPHLAEQPDELLAELNGQKRPDRIAELLRIAQSRSRRIFAERG
jgi:hypothetical protein